MNTAGRDNLKRTTVLYRRTIKMAYTQNVTKFYFESLCSSKLTKFDIHTAQTTSGLS